MRSSGSTVGVAGTGLIGGSIALRARTLGRAVVGWDRDGDNLRLAVERGALNGTASSLAELAAGCDLLVLAAPLDATLEHLRELATLSVRPALTIDVASVKVPVIRAAARLPDFVATHPIAGSERSGPSAAHAELFVGKAWAFDPAAGAQAAEDARAFVGDMGATPFAIGAEDHDRIVALTSHLPQLLSVALGARLAAALDRPEVQLLCGTGIASMLRLSASSWPMWRSVLDANAEALAQEVRKLADVLKDFAEALETGRAEELQREFAAAAGAVARLEALKPDESTR